MRRFVAPQNAASVSLFPFLAVLLCTMGALILLLIVIARQAQISAAHQADDPPAPATPAATQEDVESIQWRIDRLTEQRAKTEADLARKRLELGHLEEHTRKLTDELNQLNQAWAASDQNSPLDGARRQELTARLDQLRDQLAAAERRLNNARGEADQQREVYAVIPYEGPHATRRRPVYIECRVDGVYLQPEGVRLTEEDFQGPLTNPGNPLAAALRAAREHLTRYGSDEQGEPYPLLLVRPSGIIAYYVARAALQSWGSEFGYELIDEDWELAYQAPDPALEAVERRAVESARERLRQLAMAVPGSYGRETRPSFAAPPPEAAFLTGGGSSRYGSVAGGGASPGTLGRWGSDGGPYPSERNLPGARRGGRSRTDAVNLEDIYGPALERPAAPSAGSPGDGSFADSPGSSGEGQRAFDATQRGEASGWQGGGDGSGQSDRIFDEAMTAGADRGGRAGRRQGDSTNTTASDGPLMTDPRGRLPHREGAPGSAGSLAGGSGQRTSDAGGRVSQGQRSATESAESGDVTPSGSRLGEVNQQFGGSTGVSSAAGGQAGGSSSSAGHSHADGQTFPQEYRPPQYHRDAKRELAAVRGKNWAVREPTKNSVAITRPIRLQCHADRIIVVPESKVVTERDIIYLGPRTEESVDELVERIWRRMDGWGIAGRGMHWRPVLQLEVTPSGVDRAQDLKDLLDNSGLAISEKPIEAPTALRPGERAPRY